MEKNENHRTRCSSRQLFECKQTSTTQKLTYAIVYVTVDEGTRVVHHRTWLVLNLAPTCVRITCWIILYHWWVSIL